jgi:hypothetical protein
LQELIYAFFGRWGVLYYQRSFFEENSVMVVA